MPGAAAGRIRRRGRRGLSRVRHRRGRAMRAAAEQNQKEHQAQQSQHPGQPGGAYRPSWESASPWTCRARRACSGSMLLMVVLLLRGQPLKGSWSPVEAVAAFGNAVDGCGSAFMALPYRCDQMRRSVRPVCLRRPAVRSTSTSVWRTVSLISSRALAHVLADRKLLLDRGRLRDDGFLRGLRHLDRAVAGRRPRPPSARDRPDASLDVHVSPREARPAR